MDEFLGFQGVEDIADPVVQLFDDIAVIAYSPLNPLPSKGGLTFPVGMRLHGKMGCGEWKVEKEGFAFVSLDKTNRLSGELLGEQTVLEGFFHHFVTAPDRLGLVVAFVDVVGGIKPLAVGAQRFAIAEVPFTDEPGGVAFGFKDLSDGQGFGIESLFCANQVSHDALGPAKSARVGAG